MNIKLSELQKNFLYKTLEKHKQLLSGIKAQLIDNKWELNIENSLADEISEICVKELQLVGFNSEWELTSSGKILEELIYLFDNS